MTVLAWIGIYMATGWLALALFMARAWKSTSEDECLIFAFPVAWPVLLALQLYEEVRLMRRRRPRS